MASSTKLWANGDLVSDTNPLPVTSTAPTTATAGTAAAVAAVDAAADRVDTFTYLDAGTADERVSTIVSSSAAVGLSYTTTFVYAGSAGAYRVSTATRS